jgi:hypothetical protein
LEKGGILADAYWKCESKGIKRTEKGKVKKQQW